jgi:hypothetical protein
MIKTLRCFVFSPIGPQYASQYELGFSLPTASRNPNYPALLL